MNASPRQLRTKRERFLPYAYERFGLSARICGCRSGESEVPTEIDEERHLADLDSDEWPRIHVDFEVHVPEGLIHRVLPEEEWGQSPAELFVVIRCDETRHRAAQRVSDAPVRAGAFQCTVELSRGSFSGSVELTPYLVRAHDASRMGSGHATSRGARLASARPWEVRLERRRVPEGQFLDIRYRSFQQDEMLQKFGRNLYRLECDQEQPCLWINSDHDKVAAILSEQGTTGRKARTREVFFDVISQGVWGQLFLYVVSHLMRSGDPVYDWETSVLHELLPLMYPHTRNHSARMSKLRRALENDDLPVVLQQLDAALQQKNEAAAHMTRLVEETIER